MDNDALVGPRIWRNERSTESMENLFAVCVITTYFRNRSTHSMIKRTRCFPQLRDTVHTTHSWRNNLSASIHYTPPTHAQCMVICRSHTCTCTCIMFLTKHCSMASTTRQDVMVIDGMKAGNHHSHTERQRCWNMCF